MTNSLKTRALDTLQTTPPGSVAVSCELGKSLLMSC